MFAKIFRYVEKLSYKMLFFHDLLPPNMWLESMYRRDIFSEFFPFSHLYFEKVFVYLLSTTFKPIFTIQLTYLWFLVLIDPTNSL